jgi:hypothetical protein
MSSARKFALWLVFLDSVALAAVFNVLGWARGL